MQLFATIRGGLLVVSFLLNVLVLPTNGRSPNARAAVQEADEGAQLLELTERLLAQTVGTTGAQEAVRLLPGRLADELPFDLPSPPGGGLLGSLVRASDLNGTSVEVVIDAPGSPDDVVAVFDQAMRRQGWSTPPPGSPGLFPPTGPSFGGFQSPDQPVRPITRSSTYCREPNGAFFTVTLNPRESGPSDLRARLQFPPTTHTGSGYGACAVLQPVLPPGPGNIAPGPDLIPRLTVPEEARLDQPSVQGLGATGLGSYGTGATVITEIGVAALEAHFAEQLRGIGWARQAGTAGDLVAWSIWRLPREDVWRGTLVVLQRPGDDRRSLMVRVDSLADPGSGGPAVGSPGAPPPAFRRERVADPGLLRELAGRLLAGGFSGRTTDAPRPALLVGQVAPDLEPAIPLPVGTRILGSLVRAAGDTNQPQSQIVLDVPGVPLNVKAFFTDALVRSGWTPPPYSTSSGFLSVFAPLNAAFCREDSGDHLNFSIRLQANDVSDVRVTRQESTPPCWPPPTVEEFRPRFGRAPNVVVPPLVADPGLRSTREPCNRVKRRWCGTR